MCVGPTSTSSGHHALKFSKALLALDGRSYSLSCLEWAMAGKRGKNKLATPFWFHQMTLSHKPRLSYSVLPGISPRV